MDVDPQLVELGARLAESAARNTAASISTRVKTARAAKQGREALVVLEETITDLSQDRNELLQIAQAYKEQLAAETISAADVEYITSQLIPRVKEFIAMASGSESIDHDAAEQMLDAIGPLLSVETLTILQLLGFNFKKAIGEPLTNLIARAISTRGAPDPTAATELQRLSGSENSPMSNLPRMRRPTVDLGHCFIAS